MFRCAVGREGHCKQTWLVCVGSARSGWTTLGLPEPTVASLPGSHCSGFRVLCTGHCPRRALLAVHFPGLSHPGSQVLRKGAGPDGLCVLYPSQVLGECTTPGGPCVSCTSLVPASQCPRCALRAQSQMSHVSPPQSRSQAVTVLTEVNRPGSQEDVAINGEPAQVWWTTQSLGPRWQQLRLWHSCISASAEEGPSMAASCSPLVFAQSFVL